MNDILHFEVWWLDVPRRFIQLFMYFRSKTFHFNVREIMHVLMFSKNKAVKLNQSNRAARSKDCMKILCVFTSLNTFRMVLDD